MQKYASSLKSFRHRLAYAEALPQMVVLGVICGILCGLLLGLFRIALEWPLETWLPNGQHEGFESLPNWLRFCLPVVGSLLLLLLLCPLAPLKRKVGVAHLLERISYHQGQLPAGNAILQFAAALLALLTGHSAGKEGPAVHLGAACGSLLGQRMRLPNNTLRILAGCGTAAAIAAMFNTPLAGVIFAMEVVLLEYSVLGFMPVMAAAATATLVMHLLFGAEQVLNVPVMQIHSMNEIPYVLFLGVVIGLLASLFVKLTTKVTCWSTHQEFHLSYRLLIAGLLTGTCAVYVPEIMGVGYDTVTAALQGELAITALLLILLVKVLLTPVIIGLGIPAGLIGPTFFIGAIAGGALGIVGSSAVEQQVAHQGFYALIGMGSMMAAVLNAPLAALIAIMELTGNPNILFPAMIAIIVANLITRYVFNLPSIFIAIMRAQGMDFRLKPVQQVLSRSAVSSLMNTDFISTPKTLSSAQSAEILERNPNWLLIEGSPSALLPPADLAAFLKNNPDSEHISLLEIPALRLDCATLSIRSTLLEALEALTGNEVDALCIADFNGRIEGVITRNQLETYYQQYSSL
ncbi:chloride channel protein [Pontibacter sp. JAM-7]|uniref:chloride channel protein n=1 Tax=Pontibacter sp. JAM-7 TaxID=3366581 RepID=UPI003AF80B71